MQTTPKSGRKFGILYLILGLVLGLILVGVVSVLYLLSQDTPITLANLVQLHLTTPLFLIIDFLALYSSLILWWGGAQRDRYNESQRSVKLLTENQKGEIEQLQASQTEQDLKHQADIVKSKRELDEQEKKFQDLEVVIRRGKQQWQGTFDAVDDLIVLTDEEGVILRCNRATGEVFQLGYSQIIGREIDELFANGSGSIREIIPGERKQMKNPHAEVWYEISKNHLLIDGKQEGWVYIFRNVTIQRQALLEQQRQAHYYELLVNNNPVAIVTLNIEGRIIDCNPAFESLFLYSKREALGWKDDLLISPPDLVFETRLMAETVRNGETVHRITQRKRKDGSLVDVEIFWIPVILSGKQVGSLGLYHDVSELVRSQNAPIEAVVEAFEEASEAVETLPPQEPVFEPVIEEQVGELQPAEEAIAVTPLPYTKKRLIPIEDIEGIGPVYAQKLLEIGVKTTDDLLNQGKDRKGRAELVEKTGISATYVLKWVNIADLMRVHGIGEEYSELLEKAGVDTVKELRNRNAHNLYDALIQANEAHKFVRRVPHLSEVEGWVEEAKALEPIVSY